MRWLLLLCVAGCAAPGDMDHRGTFTWGHEVRAFKPCGSGKTYWVVADARLLEPLRERTQPTYIEAAGRIDTQSRREGFAKNYDGVFHLREIKEISKVVPQTCASHSG